MNEALKRNAMILKWTVGKFDLDSIETVCIQLKLHLGWLFIGSIKYMNFK